MTRAGVSNLWRQAISGGSPTQLTQFTSEQIYSYGLSHDQKTWAVVRGETSADVVLVSDKK